MENIVSQMSNLKITKKNKGTGAGGKNTTLNGGSFEKVTSIESKLLEEGFSKKEFNKSKQYYYEKVLGDYTLIYVSQWSLRTFMEQFYNTSAIRKPDEAFIIINNKDKTKKPVLNILEKKYQSGDGSVDIKLWAGPIIKREYEIYYGDKFDISYAFSLSEYLEEKMNSNCEKWIILNKIFIEYDIKSFYDSDTKYLDQVYNWAFDTKSMEKVKPTIKKDKLKDIEV